MVCDAASAAFEVGYESASQFNANTAVSSADHRCGIFDPSLAKALRCWSRSVIGKTDRIVCSGQLVGKL